MHSVKMCMYYYSRMNRIEPNRTEPRECVLAIWNLRLAKIKLFCRFEIDRFYLSASGSMTVYRLRSYDLKARPSPSSEANRSISIAKFVLLTHTLIHTHSTQIPEHAQAKCIVLAFVGNEAIRYIERDFSNHSIRTNMQHGNSENENLTRVECIFQHKATDIPYATKF